MSDIPSFPYADLWGERHVLSVANLTREDGTDFLKIAAQCGIRPTVTCFPLDQADRAIERVRKGLIDGAAVLLP
jgi:propanol-preferring alcohol dehydrogenase